MSPTRRLAALMFTDMVGYSALAREDESLAREMVDAQRLIIRDSLQRFGGREHQTTGDGFFLEFPSAVNAVQCAIDVQMLLHERGRYVPDDRQIQIRIGIHLGDILSNDEDLFGNGVNIAARIEPLAKPGGICITRQIHDQVLDRVPNTKFRKDGRKSLKNIRGGAEIFHVVMPSDDELRQRTLKPLSWIQRRFAFRTVPEIFNSGVVSALTFACVLSLTVATVGAVRSLFQADAPSLRSPAEAATNEPVDLSEGWSFRTQSDGAWKRFETHASWRHSEQLSGHYWMKKSFRTTGDFKEPGIVLGLVTDTHRTYLNGKFIGGSNRSGELTYYTFDRSLLNSNGDNELMIEGETRPSLNPGLIVLPTVGARLDEFSKVRARVHQNELTFHFLRNMYFGLTLLIFAASFCFALVRRSSMPYFYSAMILLLSAINLSYYSPWVSSTFAYQFMRFLKLIALSQIPIVLVSAQLRLLGQTKKEAINNSFSALALVAVGVLTLLLDSRPVDFIERYNMALAISSVYGLAATLWMLKIAAVERKKTKSPLVKSFQLGYLATNVLATLTIFCSIKSGHGVISAFVESTTSAKFRVIATEVGMALPFLFSLFLVTIATVDYLQQSRSVARKRRRDVLMLEIVNLMTSVKPFDEVISSLQAEMCDFLKAERSTLYVLKAKGTGVLSADYVHNPRKIVHEIKHLLPLNEGVTGYVVQNLTPLLIPDIRRDRRFFGAGAPFPVQGFESYKSGSCMLFPLLSQGQLVGVITFADKQGGGVFERQDFTTALELSSTLGLLLDNQEMRAALASRDIATAS